MSSSDGTSDPTSVEQSAGESADCDSAEESDSTGWLNFGHSRAGARADRQEARRERRVGLLVLVLVLAVVAGLLVWRPWSKASATDTGYAELGGDRVAALLVVSGPAGAVATAVVEQDRRGKGSGALVAVPGGLDLSVEGVGALSVHDAAAAAGPTLTRDALGALLGVPLVGSWVIAQGDFVAMVDRLGGIRVAGAQADGRTALARAGADAGGARDALTGFVSAFPAGFSATRALLGDLGVLDGPGLPVPRLAAVVAGLARDGAGGRLRTGALPLDSSGQLLDAAGAAPLVSGVLGGRPGQGRADTTPRIAVSIAPGVASAESDVQADVLDAGYAFLRGPLVAAGTPSAVVVRTGTPDAEQLGAAIAALFDLPGSVIRVGADLPLGADVAVVLGRQP
jgi:hypothetical protein